METEKITLDNPKSYYAGKNSLLSKETIIEVICIKENRVIKKEMTFGEALKIDKKEGWKYIFYQKGFSSFVETK